MAGDNDKYARYASIPIPTYDEATSSRPTSSQDVHSPQEGGDGAQSEGLLGQRHDRYHQPTAESTRTSLATDDEDDDLRLPEVNGEDVARRDIEEMDYLDPPDTSRRSPRLYHRARLRGKWSTHLSNLGATLSSLRLPSFRSLYRSVPTETAETPTTPPQPWYSRTPTQISIPERYRITGPTAARLAGLATLILLVYVMFALGLFPGRMRQPGGSHFDPEAVKAFIQENVNSDYIRNALQHITSFDHVAGTEGDLYLAKWMQNKWEEDEVFDEIALLPYYVYLNYPGERSVEVVQPESKKWTAKLEEDQVYPDRENTKAWHGHSKSGDVEGHLIYANGGSSEDFAWLKEHGIDTNGSIALVKYGGSQTDRALKIKAAEEAGCVGVLIYSDPSDVARASAWQQSADTLQRGSVSRTGWIVGDPLTPGYASTQHADRIPIDGNPGLPSIPSLPLAWRDAKYLMQSIEGLGERVPTTWVHGLRGDDLGNWFSGTTDPGEPNAPIVHLKNLNEGNDRQQIWNLFGMIQGLEAPQKKVLVGNHRDAWCFGSVDAGSGSAVMMELVRIFSDLRKLGWRPLRTIEFVSWDAEEYNLIGSTEYVEENIDYLRQNAMAYINVGSGVSGSLFRASGSPVWARSLQHILERIADPDSNGTQTLKQLWEQHASAFNGLGAGSDYVAFQDIAGTSSIDFSFIKGVGAEEEFYPYHSCHENFEWMMDFGDPTFEYHKVLAQIWALLIVEVADRPILPYDLRSYASKLEEWASALDRDVVGLFAQQQGRSHATAADVKMATKFTLDPVRHAIEDLARKAEEFHRFEDQWTSTVVAAGGLEATSVALQRLTYNERLSTFDTNLLDLEGNDACPEGGLPGRCQFKHVIYGPRRWSGNGVGCFPFVRDAVEDGDWDKAQHWVHRATDRIADATKRLFD